MKGIYINLDCRVDRREHFEKTILCRDFFKGVERMSAIQHADGAIGCGLSHVRALQQLYKGTDKGSDKGTPYVVVLEDDFMVFDEMAFSQFIVDFENIKEKDSWKIISLTPRGKTVLGTNEMTLCGFHRICEYQTTTGYIVKKEMIPYLCENLKEALVLQMKGGDKNIYSIDQYWKRLQDHHPFYYYGKVFAGQLPGWSDIESRFVDYNDRFRKQPFF